MFSNLAFSFDSTSLFPHPCLCSNAPGHYVLPPTAAQIHRQASVSNSNDLPRSWSPGSSTGVMLGCQTASVENQLLLGKAGYSCTYQTKPTNIEMPGPPKQCCQQEGAACGAGDGDGGERMESRKLGLAIMSDFKGEVCKYFTSCLVQQGRGTGS